MKTTFIYTLSDSTGIRYVGKADKPEARLRGHVKDSRRNKYRKDKWISSLLKNGEHPILEILEEVPHEDWKTYEQYWIHQFRTWGFNLVNGTDGGEGSDGFGGRKHSNETKSKLSEKARKQKHVSGVDVHNAALTINEVLSIRHDYDNKLVRFTDLILKYNVSKKVIINVVKRRSYRNI